MNISYVIKCIKAMRELSAEEKDEIINFINENIDAIEIDDNFVEGGPYNIDYYDVYVCGPEQFIMHFSVGAISDYLELWELSDEFSLNTFNFSNDEDGDVED